MKKLLLFFLVFGAVLGFGPAAADAQVSAPVRSQEVSESDGIPVLVKHLPDWEVKRAETTFTNRIDDLRAVLGERPVLDLIEFTGGTEAVTAPYPAGRLLVIEYMTPQASVDADNKFNQRLAEIGPDSGIVYRRIGNYNAFVFDASDPAAAGALLDQIQYQKTVQWLGEDPTLLSRMERAFVTTTRDIFVSTLIAILIGIGLSIISGIIAGFLYFWILERRRSKMAVFSDAGGMVRLNLDGLTPDISPDRLLNE